MYKKLSKSQKKKLFNNGIIHKEFQYSKEDMKLNSYLKSEYGITIKDYFSILNEQNECCAICGNRTDAKRLAVDHCHKTGKVRGLLCSNCNLGLGCFKDDKNNLKKAIDYLLKIDALVK